MVDSLRKAKVSSAQRRDRWLRSTCMPVIAMAIGGVVFSGAALAQTAETGEERSDVVVVTASRVNREGFEAPTPTTVLNVDQLQLGGANNLTAGLNQLPAFFASATPARAGNDTVLAGQNYLNIRGIGAPRTLVLVNGRRFVSSSTNNAVAGSVDVNLIPQALVQRVEVVTGGASAAWGSDAVAGVANFVLDPDINGLRAHAQYGLSGQGDNEEYLASLTYGASLADGRVHVTLSGEIAEGLGIPNQADRDWGAEGWQVFVNPSFTPTNGEFARLLRSNVHQSNRTEGGLIVSAGPLQNIQFGVGGVPGPFVRGANASSTFMVGGDGINQGRYISLVTPYERQTLYGMASFDISDTLTATFEGSFGRNLSTNPVTSSFSLAPYTIRADNAFLPASIRSTMTTNGIAQFSMGRINTDIGFITADIDNEVYRGVAALNGSFGEGWEWEASYTRGETRRVDKSLNNIVNARLTASIDSILDGGGQPVCRNLATNPGCAPINLFGFGSPSQAAIDYVTEDQVANTRLTQEVAAIDLNGEPFSTWAGPVSLVVGAEWRRESVDTAVDAISQANGFMIGNPKNLTGRYTVGELFAETVVPLLVDLPFAKAIDFNGAIRSTDYSTSGGVETWKYGATWQVIADLKFRGTVSRDIRAANLTELFQVSGLGFANVRDPRDGSSPFISFLSAGNQNLKPEEADTKTFGVVLEPGFAPGLRASVDYYDISIDGAIGSLATQEIINRCYIGGNTSLCGLIENNPDGAIRHVNNFFVNIQSLITRGMDFELSYRTSIADGDLTIRGLANYVEDLITSDGVTAVNRAGQAQSGQAQGTGLPHWRGSINAIYRQDQLSIGLTGRYVGGGAFDTTYKPIDLDDNSIESRFYVDLSGEYTLMDGEGAKVELFGVINNLFDSDPPIIGSTFQAPFATNGALYDQVGRNFTIGVRVRS